MAAAAFLVFFKKKIDILTVCPPVWGQSASACQISSISVKRLRRYGDLTVFRMATVRYLGFWKLIFFDGLDG